MKCSVCGYTFLENESISACSSCPVIGKCPLTRCPNCGYEWLPEKRQTKNIQPLSAMRKNDKGIIISTCTINKDLLKKIIAMGLLPGIQVEVKQHLPVLRCVFGYTEFALDKKIASAVLVEIKV